MKLYQLNYNDNYALITRQRIPVEDRSTTLYFYEIGFSTNPNTPDFIKEYVDDDQFWGTLITIDPLRRDRNHDGKIELGLYEKMIFANADQFEEQVDIFDLWYRYINSTQNGFLVSFIHDRIYSVANDEHIKLNFHEIGTIIDAIVKDERIWRQIDQYIKEHIEEHNGS